MLEIIPVYVTDNLEALEALARNDSIKTITKVETLASLGSKLWAELQTITQDQEKSYIIGRRYLAILDQLYKVSADKNFILLRYGSEWNRVKVLIEELKASLPARYEEQAKLRKKSKDVLKSRTILQATRQTPSPPPQEEIANHQLPPVFPGEYISCTELYNAINRGENMCIIDIRTEPDFISSQINFEPTVNIPEDLINPGLSANTLGTQLDTPARVIWERRDSFNVLVLVDWNTKAEDVFCTKIDKLRATIVDWDFNKNYRQHPVFLNGGFKEFYESYPSQVTNILFCLFRKNEDIDELLELDGIDYPESSSNNMTLKQFTIDALEESSYIEVLEDVDSNLPSGTSSGSSLKELEAKKVKINGGDKDKHLSLEKDGLEVINEEEEEANIKKKIEEQRVQFLKEARKAKPGGNGTPPSSDSSPEGSEGDAGDMDRRILPPPVRREVKPHEINDGWCGLVNIKNTCYQNAILQCLKCIPILKQIFQTTNYIRLVSCNQPLLMIEFAFVIKTLWKGTEFDKKVLRPTKFYNKICQLNPMYKKGLHEDCMEFFLFMFNILNEDCLQEIRRPKMMIEREKAWFGHLQGHTSFWVDLFYHQLQCTKLCQSCKCEVTSYETDNTLMVPVPHDKRTKFVHLDDLIEEYMDDNDILDYKCSKCDRMDVVLKKTVIVAPEILVVVLKRYYQDEITLETKKNNIPVEFSLTHTFGECEYQLCSIAEHKGSMECGHYFAHGFVNDVWVEFNDERVTRASLLVNADFDIKSSACAFLYCKQRK